MPYHCAFGLCTSDSRKYEEGVIFVPFPKPHLDENKVTFIS